MLRPFTVTMPLSIGDVLLQYGKRIFTVLDAPEDLGLPIHVSQGLWEYHYYRRGLAPTIDWVVGGGLYTGPISGAVFTMDGRDRIVPVQYSGSGAWFCRRTYTIGISERYSSHNFSSLKLRTFQLVEFKPLGKFISTTWGIACTKCGRHGQDNFEERHRCEDHE